MTVDDGPAQVTASRLTSRPGLRLTALVVGLAAAVAGSVAWPTDVLEPPAAEAVASSAVSCDDSLQVSVPVSPPLQSYTSITPRRVVDTRDGRGGHQGTVPGGCTLRLQLANSAVPDDAGAVALSLTAVSQVRGFMTSFPCDEGRPPSSSLNTRADVPTANLVVAVPDTQREICVFTSQDSDIVIDIQGWWADGASRFRPVEPVRAADTRELAEPVRLGAGEIRNLQVGGAFVPAEATSIVVNLTATETAEPGWMVIYPCGETPPLASNLNYGTGDTRAVAAVVGIGFRNGGQGQICVKTHVAAHFIIDVVGYYAPEPAFGPSMELQPVQQRLVDTRDATGPWDRPFRAREIREIDPTVGLARAEDASAVVINAIGLEADEQGYLTVFPCSDTPPLVSTLNTFPASEVANLLTVELSDEGTICVLSHTSGDVVLDLVGLMVVPDGSPLDEIVVSGPDVWPEYRIEGSDYTLACDEGSNDVTFAVEPHRGRAVRVGGKLVDDSGSVTLQLEADDLTTVELSGAGTDDVTYHFRCMPADFPELIINRAGDPEPGWYLTALGGGPDDPTFAVIFDERGFPIWYQRTSRWAINAQRLADGTIMYDTADGVGFGVGPDEAATIIELNGDVVQQLTTDDPDAFPLDHHELLERPGGGWAMLSYPYYPSLDVSAIYPTAAPDLDPDCGPDPVPTTTTTTTMAPPPTTTTTTSTTTTSTTTTTTTTVAPPPTTVPESTTTTSSTTSSTTTTVPESTTTTSSTTTSSTTTTTTVPEPEPSLYCEPAVGSVIREVGDPVDDSGDLAVPTLEWEWDALDHFDLSEVQFQQRFNNYVPLPTSGEVDLFHINSLDLQDNGDYVVSARHLDAVFRVNRNADPAHAEGDVEWILASEPAQGWVQPDQNEDRRLEIIGDPLGGPRRPHDARLDGDILTLFDNQTATTDQARAVAYEIDAEAGTATLLWQIAEPFGRVSNGLGSIRVNPDGSRLINWGGLQPMFNEFDADGELLLSIGAASSSQAYRVVKYEPSAFDIDELRDGASSVNVP